MKLRNYLPLLHIFIELPFIRVQTQLMYRSLETSTMQYVSLRVEIWKWHFEFALYDTRERMVNR